MWNKVRLGALALLVALVTSACFEISYEIDFNVDGSGTIRMEQAFDTLLLELEDVAPSEACSGATELVAEAVTADFEPGSVRTDSLLKRDGTCVVTLSGAVQTEAFETTWDTYFSATDDGWKVVLEGLKASIQDVILELGADDPNLFEGVALTISMRLPGTPSDDHNAHRIEGGRFIWEFTDENVDDAPAALRARSTVTDPNDTWPVLLFVGTVGGLAGAAVVLGVVVVVRRRRRATSQQGQAADSPEDYTTIQLWKPPLADDGAPSQADAAGSKPHLRRTLRTGQIIVLAPRLRRLWAGLLDKVILQSISLLALIFYLGDSLLDDDRVVIVASAAVLAISFAHEQILLALRGQTVGKMLFRVRLISFVTGGVPKGRVVFRKLLYPYTVWFAIIWLEWSLGRLLNLVVVIGFASLLWNKDRQTWYDRAADTIVVDARRSRE